MATKKATAPRRKKSPASPSKARRKAPPPPPPPTLPFEIDPKKVEASLERLREQVVTLAKRGRYTKVRFKFRGKQLLPDIPLAAVVAVEGATFYWAGLLRALVVTIAGGAVIDVELVNDSEKKLAQGKEALLSGDLAVALGHFQAAADMDPQNPAVQLNLGIALKLKGDAALARASLERARELDPEGPTAAEAERLLKSLAPKEAP